MKRYINFSLKDAMSFVKSKRPVISPNSGFLKQLEAYEKKLKKEHMMNDSLSSFTSRVQSEKNLNNNVKPIKILGYSNKELANMKFPLAKTQNLNHLESIKYERPGGASTPNFTPFLQKEKEKLDITLANQKIHTPTSVSSGYFNWPANALKRGAIAVLNSRYESDRKLEPIKLHPSIHEKQYRKSQFKRYIAYHSYDFTTF